MANHRRENDELRKAASDASALIGNRKAARAASDERERGGHAKVSVPANRRPVPQSKLTLSQFIAQNAVYIVAAAAVVAIFAVMLIAVRSCVPTVAYDYDGELDFDYQTPFDWANLDTSSPRYVYREDGKVRSYLGVDVSENQDEIDWDAVAADGIDYAMIRLGYRGATEGDLFVDARFSENLAGAQQAGVKCGVYFFSQAVNAKEAREEADFVIAQLEGAKLEYPVAFDFESAVAGVEQARAAGLGKDQMTEIADTFCDRIEKAGYQALIYGNYYDLDLYHYECLQRHDIWWAEYDVAPPSPHVDISMWQYANGGAVNGIPTVVDMNIDFSEVID